MICGSIDFEEVTLIGEVFEVSLNTVFFGRIPLRFSMSLRISLGFNADKSIRGNQ